MGEGNGRVAMATFIFVLITFGLDMFSTFTSSPQTTEINAKTRADTLMKWVYLADVVVVAGGVYAWSKSGRVEALLATSAVAAVMTGLYLHARNAGLASDEDGTEQPLWS